MAGVSVQAFRGQGRRFGAGLVCSEMVRCAGIEHRNGARSGTSGSLPTSTLSRSSSRLRAGDDGRGSADGRGGGADLVDLDFGCPVRKVTKTGAGATLLHDPDHAARIVSAIADAVEIPVT